MPTKSSTSTTKLTTKRGSVTTKKLITTPGSSEYESSEYSSSDSDETTKKTTNKGIFSVTKTKEVKLILRRETMETGYVYSRSWEFCSYLNPIEG